MAEKVWETLKIQYCHHVCQEVSLQAEVVYPADFLPDLPRVLYHRCSHAFTCNLDGRPSCMWAGTNPAFDPFQEESKA